MKLLEKIEIIKKAMKLVKPPKDSERCKGLGWGCPNCQFWLTYDLLEEYFSLLKWELKEK